VVKALRDLDIPNLRWPGGCFADAYHWKDGIGPRDQRPNMLNIFWGGVTENNHFGTHEFMDLCQQLETEPYICGNVGSGTVEEMQQWVEYITAEAGPMAELRKTNGRDKPWKLKYWGVGNENWGCGGRMRPQYYADLYKRFSTYVRDFGDNKLYKIACGSHREFYDWTTILMRDAARWMNGLSLHYYCRLGKSATEYGEDQWFAQLQSAIKLDELVEKHSQIMDSYDKPKRVGLMVDEWGTWHAVEPDTNPRFLYQQNTIRDALVAGLSLNIFNKHCDRVKMANIAQTVNVLQAMILTDNQKMLLTPTYHVFEMYKVHHDAKLLPTVLTCADYNFEDQSIPKLNVSASIDGDGRINISLCNLDPKESAQLNCSFKGRTPKKINGRVLTAEKITSHNTFDKPNQVKPTEFKDFKLKAGKLLTTLPPRSVVVLTIQ
jgi:alpha-N-arabinofuranosidase